MSVNEKLKDAEAGDYGSIAPEPENDAVAYVKRHTIALGVLCVLAFGAAVKVDDDLLKGRDKNGVPLDAAAAALPPTPSASAFSCKVTCGGNVGHAISVDSNDYDANQFMDVHKNDGSGFWDKVCPTVSPPDICDCSWKVVAESNCYDT